MSKIKMKLLRPLALGLINLLASDIRDVRTGEIIGRDQPRPATDLPPPKPNASMAVHPGFYQAPVTGFPA
jgi:hypothetical protein